MAILKMKLGKENPCKLHVWNSLSFWFVRRPIRRANLFGFTKARSFRYGVWLLQCERVVFPILRV
ncbi:hypothetical protein ACSBR1_015509 [Camellia fascicularis]